LEEERQTEELEVFRHSRRRSRYHACSAEQKEKKRAAELEKRRKRQPRPAPKRRIEEDEEW